MIDCDLCAEIHLSYDLAWEICNILFSNQEAGMVLVEYSMR
jgi:hypothetical protein